MNSHQLRINTFMKKAQQKLPRTPIEPDLKTKKLRAALILEEALETIELGLGLKVYMDDDKLSRAVKIDREHIFFKKESAFNMVELADGCADLSVVNIGTFSACGINAETILEAVDKANLAKFTGDGHTHPKTGKWIKPSNWKAPDIKGLLKKQGWNEY